MGKLQGVATCGGGCFLVYFMGKSGLCGGSAGQSAERSGMNRYLDSFMKAFPHEGLTYDDVTLVTQYADFLPDEASIETKLTSRMRPARWQYYIKAPRHNAIPGVYPFFDTSRLTGEKSAATARRFR